MHSHPDVNELVGGDVVDELDVHTVREQRLVDAGLVGQVQMSDVHVGDADQMRIGHRDLPARELLAVDPGRRRHPGRGRSHVHTDLSGGSQTDSPVAAAGGQLEGRTALEAGIQ